MKSSSHKLIFFSVYVCFLGSQCDAFLPCLRMPTKTYFSTHHGTASNDSNLSGNSTTADSSSALSLQIEEMRKQAEALRSEADNLKSNIQLAKAQKEQKRKDKIDLWLDHLLVNQTISENMQNLNTPDIVFQRLKDERFSPDQIDQMFERLCETSSITGRDSLERNALLQILVEAAGKLDALDREDNPNKRWTHRVEHEIYKKLFAMEWGIDLEKVKEEKLLRSGNGLLDRFRK